MYDVSRITWNIQRDTSVLMTVYIPVYTDGLEITVMNLSVLTDACMVNVLLRIFVDVIWDTKEKPVNLVSGIQAVSTEHVRRR